MPVKDTIVALATPPGRSGIGVIRLSGSRSLEISRHLIQDENFVPAPNRATLKKLSDPITGEILDYALLTYFKSPHSFTGEDIVELSCHGSPVLLRHLIDLLLSLDARLAGPGEFTLRALANGRLNLSQAEAIRDLINAQTQAAVKQATRQLGGELSALLQPLKDLLLDIIVPLESSLEFVEDDLPDIVVSQFQAKLSTLINHIEQIASTFTTGRLIRDGLKVTLMGRPNVGKSSVFNRLLGVDRAIVTSAPGTTRDSLSEAINIQGAPVFLTDTAGLRISADLIENLGVERTRRAVADSDLIIVVLDGSEPRNLQDYEVFNEVAHNNYLIAVNKSDLETFKEIELEQKSKETIPIINISAKTGEGFDSLRDAILEPFATSEVSNSGLLITDARHFDLLRRTQSALRSSADLLEERASEELVLIGLYDALRFLGEITGETTTEDILSQIFATFCIGK
ncbi:MAG TPA: tRNA uridine-5-carboxymethylaminomethyl(34) synthesis GTPase MnmE [Pyrinomonadaceae bacterium]